MLFEIVRRTARAIDSIGMPLVFEAIDGTRFTDLFNLCKDFVFDIEVFDDGLDDQIAVL